MRREDRDTNDGNLTAGSKEKGLPMPDDGGDARIDIFLRPLAIIELEDERMLGAPAELDAQDLLAFVGGMGRPALPQEIIQRYKEISTGDLDLIAVPAESEILEKVVWPLKSAKICYCLGNYLACIAMTGLVGEMIAVLILEAKRPGHGKPGWPKRDDFEKKGQLDRIENLINLGIISDGLATHLRELQGIRRGYLHRFSFSHTQLVGNARKTYKAAFRVVQEILGLKVSRQSSAFQVDPDVLRYIKTKMSVDGPRE
jgi:hypothetical protein